MYHGARALMSKMTPAPSFLIPAKRFGVDVARSVIDGELGDASGPSGFSSFLSRTFGLAGGCLWDKCEVDDVTMLSGGSCIREILVLS
jgi:hypothetical protein